MQQHAIDNFKRVGVNVMTGVRVTGVRVHCAVTSNCAWLAWLASWRTAARRPFTFATNDCLLAQVTRDLITLKDGSEIKYGLCVCECLPRGARHLLACPPGSQL